MRSCPAILKGKQIVYTKTGPKIEKIQGSSGRREDTPLDGEDDASPLDKQDEAVQIHGATVLKEEVAKAEKAKVSDGTSKRKGKARAEEEGITEESTLPDEPKLETRKRARLSLRGESQANEDKQEAPKRSMRIRRAPAHLKQEMGGTDGEAIKTEEA
ncbi:hypothetical protein KC336_g20531 [Hortaea werneckii]|nr:hypothetical protein KC336_g20531 [Hortaea werneckii]